ncbi:hypothetical protein [Clostridium kluyveri]|uniref:hypothetical protein n=1 Tax=Clostridium kluyveri TaxID=1534 RepID=UPI00224712D4|nr:hypothetical protein [Clostridium kluyveri]UZQ50602.1 hypothetical protein OP486_22210 [Clostridium kluyveri]UZQ51621.1 hypothetical protein OP486_05420 [Clostridium kluyveri]
MSKNKKKAAQELPVQEQLKISEIRLKDLDKIPSNERGIQHHVIALENEIEDIKSVIEKKKDDSTINNIIESLEFFNKEEVFLADEEKIVALNLLKALDGQTVFRATAILKFTIKAIQFYKIQ